MVKLDTAGRLKVIPISEAATVDTSGGGREEREVELGERDGGESGAEANAGGEEGGCLMSVTRLVSQPEIAPYFDVAAISSVAHSLHAA